MFKEIVVVNSIRQAKALAYSDLNVALLDLHLRALPTDNQMISTIFNKISEIKLRVSKLTTTALLNKTQIIRRYLEEYDEVKHYITELNHSLANPGARSLTRILMTYSYSLTEMNLQFLSKEAPKKFFSNFLIVKESFENLKNVVLIFQKRFADIVIFVANLSVQLSEKKRKWKLNLKVEYVYKLVGMPAPEPDYLNMAKVTLSRREQVAVCKSFFRNCKALNTFKCGEIVQALRQFKLAKIVFTRVYQYDHKDIIWEKDMRQHKYSVLLRKHEMSQMDKEK